MSNAQKGVRFPKALLILPQGEWLTEEQIAEMCGVSSRTAYRWYTQGWLKRNTDTKLTTYTVNDKFAPKVVINTKIKPPKRFTQEQLAELYQKIMDGENVAQVIDLNKFIREEASADIIEKLMNALEDYHEFLTYILLNKR